MAIPYLRNQGMARTAPRLPGTGNLSGTNSMYDPTKTRQKLGNMYDRLIDGDNPAADIGERVALGGLGRERSETDQAFRQDAAAAGLRPGDVGYDAARQRASAGVNTRGSGVLSTLAQQRLIDQRQNLRDASGFNMEQQQFGEGVRRFDTEFGEGVRRFDTGQGNWEKEFGAGREDAKTRNLFHLLQNSDLLSEGQVGALKGALGGNLGLAGDQWNRVDPNMYQRALSDQVAYYKAVRPGITDAEAMKLAQADLSKANPYDYLSRAAGDAGGSASDGGAARQSDFGDKVGSAMKDVGKVLDPTDWRNYVIPGYGVPALARAGRKFLNLWS